MLALALRLPPTRQPAGIHVARALSSATRSSSTPSIGVLASGQAVLLPVRAVTAPEATPSVLAASARVKFQTPLSPCTPRRRSLRPSDCLPKS